MAQAILALLKFSQSSVGSLLRLGKQSLNTWATNSELKTKENKTVPFSDPHH